MDAAAVFQQGLGSMIPRQPQQYFFHPQAPSTFPQPVQSATPLRRPPTSHRDEEEGNPHRIAHTLTACCRCRQRKTRCDPTLPRCLPCERSGSVCEYFDTTRGKKISRFYVVKLQEKVRQLEAELSQYTDEDNDHPESAEDLVRPGGLVKLNESDETPRYLGPSSGIAMTRLLMEQAKRYTDSQRISELIPDVRARRLDRLNRMQSIVDSGASISGPAGHAANKKSFPMISELPASTLPSPHITDKLVEVFMSRAQYFTPILHEKVFARDLQEVQDGNNDSYKNFVVRMVLAISLQKLDIQYAGLADSYYLAAMQHFEDVIRTKDLKTLQCLILIALYSLLTPTRNVVFHIIGLATRICQQLGLADEKTISAGYNMGLIDALQMDMRRRLSWIVTGDELGLAQSMGRPNGFAKGDDFIDVQFFTTVDDEFITEQGIQAGTPSEKKLVAIHFCKMRLREAEIRRILYEKKRSEPKDASSPLFLEMERKIKEWVDTAPAEPVWCKPWFTGRYHTMVISLHRPSPQIPRPTSRSALICYDSSVYTINLSNQQIKKSAVDITWEFVLCLNMSLNVLLWAISYREVREEHSKEEVEEIINVALDVIDQCSERWPGTKNASQLYSVLGRACLQSYDTNDDPSDAAPSAFTSPLLADSDSPAASDNSVPTTISNGSAYAQNQQRPVFTQPVFGYTVDAPENMNVFNFDTNPFQQPTFRSNSIFKNPSSDPMDGRRPSYGYFPPDFKQPSPGEPPVTTDLRPPPPPPVNSHQTQSSPTNTRLDQIPTPPDSNTASSHSFSPPHTMSPGTAGSPTPKMAYSNPMPLGPGQQQQQLPPVQIKQPHPQQQPQPQQQQRPLPQAGGLSDWFSPPPPFISPYSFGGMNSTNGFWNESAVSNAAFSGLMGSGEYPGPQPTSVPGPTSGFGGGQGMPSGFGFAAQRHGSLSADQQIELMNILETDGVGEINNFLGMDMSGIGGNPGPDGNIRWN
ncbi:hypothetical protein M406DRAFT_89463 [Cryphonectria parasitica EP155]|uniref:Zn(2)-C6 fungal-type domain-containing protein n=1 Tax=Cryphonectria parasitica (strain ATCC 38755 / EP155) TaxID=660469 RepID=A0A9P4Y683_CRYP1|nr:uncharacterized protein M406DRAFT_89463 [Cryphonectria parasitica EP155]KAF3766845.1 hypothetical protein M406DRAFT_89463 [Cryphonectria parasitica EP155]